MSAACVILPQILPRVWATASVASAWQEVEKRKSPHRLRLVQAKEEVVWPKTARTEEPGFAFYRKYTEAILRRYLTMSMAKAKIPSLLGRELFGGKATYYSVKGFDDVVIFVHDVDRCLEELSPGLQHLVQRIAIEGYSQSEAAALLGIGYGTVRRRYAEAIDTLTRLMLDRKILHLAFPLFSGSEETAYWPPLKTGRTAIS